MALSQTWIDAGFPDVTLMEPCIVMNTLIDAYNDTLSKKGGYSKMQSIAYFDTMPDYAITNQYAEIRDFDSKLFSVIEGFANPFFLDNDYFYGQSYYLWTKESLIEYYTQTHTDDFILLTEDMRFGDYLFARWAYQRMWILNQLKYTSVSYNPEKYGIKRKYYRCVGRNLTDIESFFPITANRLEPIDGGSYNFATGMRQIKVNLNSDQTFTVLVCVTMLDFSEINPDYQDTDFIISKYRYPYSDLSLCDPLGLPISVQANRLYSRKRTNNFEFLSNPVVLSVSQEEIVQKIKESYYGEMYVFSMLSPTVGIDIQNQKKYHD